MNDYERLLQMVEQFASKLRREGMGAWAADLESQLISLRPHDFSKQVAQEYINWFNLEYRRKFEVHDGLIQLVRALIARWYSLEDMQAVTRYLADEWRGDERMGRYFVPMSLLTALRFQERLDLARERMGQTRVTQEVHPKFEPPTVKDPVAPGEVRALAATVLGRMKQKLGDGNGT